MKRDPDLIRRIAFEIEALPPAHALASVEGVDAHTFAAHVEWMEDAGLLEATITRPIDNTAPNVRVARLTWKGCDFLDAARSDTLWAKAKKSVIAPAASWTFDILTDWLKEEIRQGLPTVQRLVQ